MAARSDDQERVRKRLERMLRQLLILILSLTIPVCCKGQASEGTRPPSPSARSEQVLTNFVQAVGGITAYDSIKTSFSKGSIVDWDGDRIPFEKYWKFPDKELIIEHKSRVEIRRGHDGKARWVQEGNHKPKQIKNWLENEVSFGDVMHWSNKFRKTDFWGEADVLNRKTYVLAVNGRRPATLYFDQQTGLLLRKDSIWDGRPAQTYYSNYVETEGVKLPWHIVSVFTATGRRYVANITEAKTNVPLDDAIFAMPTP
jgi:hypothetical protein